MSGTVDVVLDLETFGVGHESAVVSIGAVIVGGDPNRDFYAVIDSPSGDVEPGSVMWWLQQRAEVRDAVRSGQDEHEVLAMFMRWLQDEARGQGTPEFPRRLRLWGSEDFDTVILGNAYRRACADQPWHYQEPRGLRTLLDLAGIDEDSMPWEGIEHIAIDCARHAAAALTLAFDRLGVRAELLDTPA